ncbi:MAG: hypothetical protein ACRD5R_13175 [Candidatus Acidiferrales bacterium]
MPTSIAARLQNADAHLRGDRNVAKPPLSRRAKISTLAKGARMGHPKDQNLSLTSGATHARSDGRIPRQ